MNAFMDGLELVCPLRRFLFAEQAAGDVADRAEDVAELALAFEFVSSELRCCLELVLELGLKLTQLGRHVATSLWERLLRARA